MADKRARLISAELRIDRACPEPARQSVSFRCFVYLVLILSLANDLNKYLLSEPKSGAVWASWIGEIPTAAELYGDAASELPTAEAFNDDDDEDEELDASATNEYPDNDNDSDEAYEDADDNDNAESGRKERWLSPLPRSKRSLAKRATTRQPEDEFGVDEDGEEDAWVHDGVDDISIDPETKRAASELSYDEQSIDAEYEPKSNVVNRTRVTTIEEVIPMVQQPQQHSDEGQRQSSLKRPQYAAPERRLDVFVGLPVERMAPAAHLIDIGQVERMLAGMSGEAGSARPRRHLGPTTGAGEKEQH